MFLSVVSAILSRADGKATSGATHALFIISVQQARLPDSACLLFWSVFIHLDWLTYSRMASLNHTALCHWSIFESFIHYLCTGHHSLLCPNLPLCLFYQLLSCGRDRPAPVFFCFFFQQEKEKKIIWSEFCCCESAFSLIHRNMLTMSYVYANVWGVPWGYKAVHICYFIQTK